MIWLAKTLLFFSSFLFLSNIAYSEVFRSEFLSSPTFYGTETRDEYEYKFAVDLDQSGPIKIKDIGAKVIKKLQELSQGQELSFAQQIFEKYKNPEAFETFVFSDIYFDTDDKTLLKKNAAYRLRYRWSRQEKYYRYQLFPFLSVFYPDRCEVQFKNGYKADQAQGTVSVEETRFEFRNDSKPFKKNKSAPASPWLESTFIEVAKKGKYKNYPILPMQKLLKAFPSVKPKLFLQPKLRVITERYRTHLDIKSPWGVGPNPNQAFILTFDLVSAYDMSKKAGRSSKKRLLEFELEIDRNISSEIDRVSQLPNSKNLVEVSAKEFSIKARKNLVSDLKKIRSLVAGILINDYGLSSLPVENKYSRLSRWVTSKD